MEDGARIDGLPDILDVQQVAHFLRVSRNTVYDLIHGDHPKLRSLRFGRTIRIPKEALEVFLRGGEPAVLVSDKRRPA